MSTISNTLYHEAYEITSCFRKQNDKAYQPLQNSIKIVLGIFGAKL